MKKYLITYTKNLTGRGKVYTVVTWDYTDIEAKLHFVVGQVGRTKVLSVTEIKTN